MVFKMRDHRFNRTLSSLPWILTCKSQSAAWLRISVSSGQMFLRVSQRCESISFWRGSGSGDPHLGIVDPDPRIHLSVIVDPDLHLEKVDPDPGPKWIRIRVPIFNIFHIFFMSDKLQYLFLLPSKFRKGISQITKTFSFTFYST